MAKTVDHYAIVVSANAKSIPGDMAKASADAEKGAQEIVGKIESTSDKSGGGIQKGYRGVRKEFKGLAKDAAFAGMAIDQIGSAFGADDKGFLHDALGLTKTIALGWAIGGPIGAGVGAVLGLIKQFAGKSELDDFDDKAKARIQKYEKQLLKEKRGEPTSFAEAADQSPFYQMAAARGKAMQAEREGILLVAEAVDELNKALTKEIDLLGATDKAKKLYDLDQQDAVRRQFIKSGARAWMLPEQKFTDKQRAQAASKIDEQNLGKLTDSFREQTAVLGMNEREIEHYKIAMLGLGVFEKASADLRADIFHDAKMHADMKKYTDGLYEQADALGLTANQAKIYADAKAGASQADVDSAVKAAKIFEERQTLQKNSREMGQGITTLRAASLTSAAGVEAQAAAERNREQPTATDGWDTLAKKLDESTAVQEGMKAVLEAIRRGLPTERNPFLNPFGL